MDISQLAGLGKVAGIGGIAIGAIVLRSGHYRPSELASGGGRGPFLQTVVIGAFAIGALGIGVGFTGAQIVRTRGKNPPPSRRTSKDGGVQSSAERRQLAASAEQ